MATLTDLIVLFGIGVLAVVLAYVQVSLWRRPLIQRHGRRNGGR